MPCFIGNAIKGHYGLINGYLVLIWSHILMNECSPGGFPGMKPLKFIFLSGGSKGSYETLFPIVIITT